YQQIFEQLTPLRAVAVTIELDVPIDVVNEIAQVVRIVLGTVERVEEPAEHLRYDIFATVEERRQDLFRRTGIGQGHRLRDKDLYVRRRTGQLQGYLDRNADQYQRAELLEPAGAGADLTHGAEVEAEVADIRAVGPDIALSSPITISLMRRAARSLPGGNHGTFMQVMSCCSRFSSDMKSQTAK